MDVPEYFSVKLKKTARKERVGFTFLNGEQQFLANYPSIPEQHAPSCLIVKEVLPLGLAAMHNATKAANYDPKCKIRTYDRVLSVNGEREPEKMRAILQEPDETFLDGDDGRPISPDDPKKAAPRRDFVLEFERYPTTWTITLDRGGASGGQKTGISFDQKYSHTHLRILHVLGGAKRAAGSPSKKGAGEGYDPVQERLKYAADGYQATTLMMAHNQRAAGRKRPHS